MSPRITHVVGGRDSDLDWTSETSETRPGSVGSREPSFHYPGDILSMPNRFPSSQTGATPQGAVAWPEFFEVYAALPAPLDLVIERESGQERAQDVRLAHSLIRSHLKSDAALR